MLIRKLVTVALIVPISLIVLAWAGAQQKAQPKRQQEQRAQDEEVIELGQCRVVWKDQRTISSKIPGIIERIYVTEGDTVMPGMLLAELDYREKEIEYRIGAAVARSVLGIQIADARSEEYRAELDTAVRLFKSRAVSEEERRLAEVRWKISKLEADRERENHEIEQLKAEQLKVQLDDHRIVSPMKGIVQKVYKREKEALSIAGGLELFRLVDPDVVWVEGDVPVRYLYRVRRGLEVEVQASYMDSERRPIDLPQAKLRFRGRIVFVDPEVQLVNKTFLVRAEVVNTGHVLRQGLAAFVTIELGPARAEQPKRVAQRLPIRPFRPGFEPFIARQ